MRNAPSPEPALGEVILWHSPECENVVSPTPALVLLNGAIAAHPRNALLHVKLAELHLDGFDFAAAASALEAALRLDPDAPGAPERLAHCYNAMGRHREALGALAALRAPHYERGIAFAGLGHAARAESELRAVLAADPNHRHACRKLCGLLRKAGRTAALLETCETLSALGVGHAQLLLDWGLALALAGEDDKAHRLLFDRARVAEIPLPVPEGFSDIAAFNAAMADELLANRHALSDFPPQEANRGSRRVHALLAGHRPELIRRLLASIQAAVEAYAPPRRGAFDPWLDARPREAHIKAWGLIQRGQDHEEWHSHPGGWLSGVYYIRIPKAVSTEGAGPGCIEFGPPPPVARERPELVPIWRHAPSEGVLLLAPSHYAHRTIPSGADDYRISFAFDIVPER
jgi:tetratricopeptide (TPR) repeat protein